MSEMAHHVRGIGLEGGLRGKGVSSEGGARFSERGAASGGGDAAFVGGL